MSRPSDPENSDELMDDLEDLHNLLDELEADPNIAQPQAELDSGLSEPDLSEPDLSESNLSEPGPSELELSQAGVSDSDNVPTLNEPAEAQEDLFGVIDPQDKTDVLPVLDQSVGDPELTTAEPETQAVPAIEDLASELTKQTLNQPGAISAEVEDAIHEAINSKVENVVSHWVNSTLMANIDDLHRTLTRELSDTVKQQIEHINNSQP